MSKHYKKLVLILLSACAGFCFALALGSAEQPSQLTQEEQNKNFVRSALRSLFWITGYETNFYFDPNYVHHLPSMTIYSPRVPWDIPGFVVYDSNHQTPLTLAETISWYSNGIDPAVVYDLEIHPAFVDIIAEADKVVVRFDRLLFDNMTSGFDGRFVSRLSSEMWILRIYNGKIVEGWSVAEPGPDAVSQEDRNKALVKSAIEALEKEPNARNLPVQFITDYTQFDSSLNYLRGIYRPLPGAGVFDNVSGDIIYIQHIIAEGDMVAVSVWMDNPNGGDWSIIREQMGFFRIASGKIVEGWISMCFEY